MTAGTLAPHATIKGTETMGFLDKVKDAANKAADQAKHATAVGKEKLGDARLHKKINELCQEIGEPVVSQRRNEAPADADTQINAKIDEIAQLEKQIDENDVDDDTNRAASDDDSGGDEATA